MEFRFLEEVSVFSTESRPDLRSTQLSNQQIYWGLFPPGKKTPGGKSDHSTTSNPIVNNVWISTAAPSNVFMA
jgi:hypothetical protein